MKGNRSTKAARSSSAPKKKTVSRRSAEEEQPSGVLGLTVEQAFLLAKAWSVPSVGTQKAMVHNRHMQLKDFKLGKLIGMGTFSAVRMVKLRPVEGVEDTDEQPCPMVLKTMKKKHILQLFQVEHVKAERQILALCSSPFIVAFLASFQDERRLFLLLEHVHGGELYGRLHREGRLPVDHSKFYAAELVQALHYLHGLTVVYRDIKPENIMIDRTGHVKLVDFGFAKLLGSGLTYSLVGTPEYLAPEIVQSKGHGRPVDYWALGVLIYEMLTGYPPFYDQSPFGIYKKILAKDITFPRHFDVKAKHLVDHMLQPDTGKRAAYTDCLYHLWFDFIDWGTLNQQSVRPPWRPRVETPEDTTLFDVPETDDHPDGFENAPAVGKQANKIFEGMF